MTWHTTRNAAERAVTQAVDLTEVFDYQTFVAVRSWRDYCVDCHGGAEALCNNCGGRGRIPGALATVYTSGPVPLQILSVFVPEVRA